KAIEIVASTFDHGLFAFAYGLQIDRNGTSTDAVLTTTLCEIGDACAGHHRFIGGKTGVNTHAPKGTALDHRAFAACRRESAWEESAALTGTDYNHIIVCDLLHPMFSSFLYIHHNGVASTRALRFSGKRNRLTLQWRTEAALISTRLSQSGNRNVAN